MKPQVILACAKVEDTPVMIALVNPTKSDKANFIYDVIKAAANVKPGTGNRSNQKVKVVGTLSAMLETETKTLMDE
jgi:hypothetical protein